MRIFVTGATGFIGSHVVAAALTAGHDVVALRRPGATPRVALPDEPSWREGTIDTLDARALDGCDALVHLAAFGVVPGPPAPWTEYLQANAGATMHVLECARMAEVPRLIVSGSCFEYGRSAESYDAVPVDAPLLPIGAYAASKAAASVLALAWARAHAAALALLRPFMVYGDGEAPTRLWPGLVAAAQRGDDFPCTAGAQVRDFIRVEAVADTFVQAATNWTLERGTPIIRNVGTGRGRTVREFCAEAWDVLGARGRLHFGAIPYRTDEVMRYVAQVDPAP
jgi:nucleoside-diphosphate-sugar epimerase